MCLGGGAVVLAAATLSAFIIICRLAFNLLAAGTRTLWFCPWGSKRFKADHWVGHASPSRPHLSSHLSSARFSPSPHVQTSPSCVRLSLRLARVPPAPRQRRLIGHLSNGLLKIRISPYYFVRLGEIKIDCPISLADWAFFWR